MTYAPTLEAAGGDIGYRFFVECYKQLVGPIDQPAKMVKHHNMLRLIGPSKAVKSEVAKQMARLYVGSAEEPLSGRWMEMDQIIPDNSRRTVWVSEVLSQPVKTWVGVHTRSNALAPLVRRLSLHAIHTHSPLARARARC